MTNCRFCNESTDTIPGGYDLNGTTLYVCRDSDPCLERTTELRQRSIEEAAERFRNR